MSIEILSVLTYTLLILVTVIFQANYAASKTGLTYNLGNRDQPQANKPPLQNRIERTLGNLKEGGILYLPLALLAVSTEISNSWTYYAALATILSRILYVPIYIIGIPVVRTLVWTPSLLAIPAMAYGIVTGLTTTG
ncbi:MAPEG family protein [Marinomonas sp. IMCC 4694]|uniref:MAPEG family protein n=1 Tax=Marinomonas sp. IMCC 4694 TaxID=2605432 RepID=UPI0011E75120|nr:MAPEG family protein [Marinomonas sp. IMCC 4694]TYL49163.1 hypothetical protein FXV75_15295 [Marinomonas sp. IMCC 4694]